MNAYQKILKAKSAIIIDHPFFATILLATPITESDKIPTMATDGDSILYNAKFTDSLTVDETIFVLCHEVLHCVFDHMGRRSARTPNRWNQAADYVINEILQNDNIGSMPVGALYNPNLTKKAKGTTEGVYNLLPESAEKKNAGTKGGALDQVFDSGTKNGTQGTDAATLSEKSSGMRVKVAQAKNVAKSQGKLSDNLKRVVDDFTKPKVDWREVLRNFVSEKVKLESTWAKPKRRFLGSDLYLPSLNGEKLGRITVAVDCSGSVDQKLLTAFSSEIQGIRDSLYPSKIEVIYFDSKVCFEETIEEGQDVKLTPHGGGGTAFSPIFKKISEKEEQPLCTIVLTDLICDDFGNAPNYPVLWCVLEGVLEGYSETPFGEIIEVTHET